MTAKDYVWKHLRIIGEHYEEFGYSRGEWIDDKGMSKDEIFHMLDLIKKGELTL